MSTDSQMDSSAVELEKYEYLMSNYTEILNVQQLCLINVLFTGVAKVSNTGQPPTPNPIPTPPPPNKQQQHG